MSQGRKLSTLNKVGNKIEYQGELWNINKPKPSTAKGKKMMVLASKTINGEKRVKLIHFGALGYGHNYSNQAKRSYLARSAEIRNKGGKITKDDPFSANFWARKVLWPKNQKATGPRKTKK